MPGIGSSCDGMTLMERISVKFLRKVFHAEAMSRKVESFEMLLMQPICYCNLFLAIRFSPGIHDSYDLPAFGRFKELEIIHSTVRESLADVKLIGCPGGSH